MPTTLSNSELLAMLVSFDSASENSNLPIADFVCNYLDHSGIEIERFPHTDEKKVNLLIRIGPDDDIKSGLMYSGHLDVVAAEESGWRTDPFTLTEINGAYFGRGSCDMKGSIALAMNQAVAIAEEELVYPFYLLLTCDEELGSLGAQSFCDTWPADKPLPRNVLIGEPTSLRVVRMHKGHLKLQITIHGKAAHSGFPHKGINAIERAATVLNLLTDLRKSIALTQVETSHFFPETPYPALNIATISGGSAINVIPDTCTIKVGIRLLPGMDTDCAINNIKQLVANTLEEDQYEVTLINNSPPMLLDEDTFINREICELIDQSDSFGVSFSSDAGVLSKRMNLQCVLFGPGSIDVAHRPNEYLPIDEFIRAEELFGKIIHRFCMGENCHA